LKGSIGACSDKRVAEWTGNEWVTELSVVAIEKPEGMGVVIEQAHFIKTVEDLHGPAGTVTNSSSVDIANVCVYVGGLSTDTTGSATTAAVGTYTVTGLVADHYIVEFDPTCGGRTTSNLAIQFYDTSRTLARLPRSRSAPATSPA
jgi:hypothetical protein